MTRTMLYYSTNKNLRTTVSVLEEREKNAARIAAECKAKVAKAIKSEIDDIWQAYYDADGDDASIAWDAWAAQLQKECDDAVPTIVASVVSHHMCGSIDLYYNPTPLYKAVCRKLSEMEA